MALTLYSDSSYCQVQYSPTRSGDGDAAAPQTCGSAGRRGEAPPRGGPGTPRRQRLHGGRAEADPEEPPSPAPPLPLRRSPCTPRERRRPHPARTAARGAGAPSQPRPAAATHRRCGRYRRAILGAPPRCPGKTGRRGSPTTS